MPRMSHIGTLVLVLVAVAAAGAAHAAERPVRVWRTPTPLAADAADPACAANLACAEALEGGDAAPARPVKTWSIRSSHIAADVAPAAPSVGVWIEIDADDYLRPHGHPYGSWDRHHDRWRDRRDHARGDRAAAPSRD